MANKKTPKVSVLRERFDEALKYKKTSIRKLGHPVTGVGWSDKQIRRCLKNEKMTPDMLDKIGCFLDVEPMYLSGAYDPQIDRMTDPILHSILSARLRPENYPYIKKIQNMIGYETHFQNELIMSGITIEDYRVLTWDQRQLFRQELHAAIAMVISKFFPKDAFGNSTAETVAYLESMIGDLDPEFAETEGEHVVWLNDDTDERPESGTR